MYTTNGNDPINYVHGEATQHDSLGLTKREHFAALAMQAILTGRSLTTIEGKDADDVLFLSKAAILATAAADHLIDNLNIEEE